MPGDFAAQAAKIATDKIGPALDRQLAELEAHRKRATSDAGVWKLPQGDAYYAWALRAATTTRMTPDEIHARGQEELEALQAEMDAILKGQGLTRGHGRRAHDGARQGSALTSSRTTTRAARRSWRCIEDRVADIRTRLPRAFATLVPGNFEIKRMAPEVEPGAPGAYGGPGSIDGKVPGKFWINLRTTDLWRTFSLPTLTYHESLPGHVWQGEYTFKLPLVRSLLAFNAYSEGWALYAEQLADELGVYEGDPVGRLGYLQSIAFRACRLVVDTGLHAKRWTREQAIEWFATTNGSGVDEVTSEVERYCAWPGQACGYKVGHSEINRLRASCAAGAGREVRPASVQRRRRQGRRRADGRAGADGRGLQRPARLRPEVRPVPVDEGDAADGRVDERALQREQRRNHERLRCRHVEQGRIQTCAPWIRPKSSTEIGTSAMMRVSGARII